VRMGGGNERPALERAISVASCDRERALERGRCRVAVAFVTGEEPARRGQERPGVKRVRGDERQSALDDLRDLRRFPDRGNLLDCHGDGVILVPDIVVVGERVAETVERRPELVELPCAELRPH